MKKQNKNKKANDQDLVEESGRWRIAKKGEVSQKTSLQLFEERVRALAAKEKSPRQEKKELEGLYFLILEKEERTEKVIEEIKEKGGKIVQKIHPKAMIIVTKETFEGMKRSRRKTHLKIMQSSVILHSNFIL